MLGLVAVKGRCFLEFSATSLFLTLRLFRLFISFAFYSSVGGGVINCVRVWLETFGS